MMLRFIMWMFRTPAERKAAEAANIMKIMGVRPSSVDAEKTKLFLVQEIYSDMGYQMQDKHQKAAFIKNYGTETAREIAQMIREEGVLGQKPDKGGK